MNIKIISALIMVTSLSLAGCSKEHSPEPESGDPKPVQFSLPRFAGVPPTTDQTFGFMIYRAAETEPPLGTKGAGTYRYNLSESVNGTLIPCVTDVNGNVLPGAANRFNTERGIHAMNATYQGFMYTPGVAPIPTEDGSLRVRYDRNIKLRATTTPFNTVVSYYKVASLDMTTTTIMDVISYFSFYFKEKTAKPITITNAKLHNIGQYALYHPKEKHNDVMMQGSETVSTTVSLNTVRENPMIGDDQDIPYHSLVPMQIFPSDYRLEKTNDLVLEFKLAMDGKSTVVNIPISREIVASRHYHIYIEVTSALINVTYQITSASWDDYNMGSTEVGGAGISIPLGTFNYDVWEDVNGSGSIG